MNKKNVNTQNTTGQENIMSEELNSEIISKIQKGKKKEKSGNFFKCYINKIHNSLINMMPYLIITMIIVGIIDLTYLSKIQTQLNHIEYSIISSIEDSENNVVSEVESFIDDAEDNILYSIEDTEMSIKNTVRLWNSN